MDSYRVKAAYRQSNQNPGLRAFSLAVRKPISIQNWLPPSKVKPRLSKVATLSQSLRNLSVVVTLIGCNSILVEMVMEQRLMK
jgi:hypothetical protein